MSKKANKTIFAGIVATLGIIGGLILGYSFFKFDELQNIFNEISRLNFDLTNDIINIGVFILILAFTTISFSCLFFGKNRKNRKNIGAVVEILNKFLIENSDENILDENTSEVNKFNKNQECVLQINEIVNKMEKHSKVKQLWNAYKNSFVTYNCLENGNVIHHTVDAEYFFNEETLLKEEIRFKFYNYLPQLFLGIGIFGTFLGLALGLQGLNITAASSDVIKESVRDLLKGVEISFYTSVFGIYFSLLSSLVINIFFDDYGKSILEIKNGLNEVFIRDRNEEILFDLKSQLIQIKLSNDELAHRLANELGEQLGILTKSMIAVMDKFNAEVSGTLITSLTEALEKIFSDGLVEAFGQLTDRLVDNLEKSNKQTEHFHKIMENILQQFDMAKNNLTEVSEENRKAQLDHLNNLKAANEGSTKALGEIMAVSSEKIKKNFEEVTETIKKVGQEITVNLGQTNDKIRGTSEIIAEIFENIEETNNEIFILAKEVKEIFMQKESFQNISDIFKKVEDIANVLQKKMDSEVELKNMWNNFGSEFKETNKNLVDSFASYREEVSKGTLEFREIIKDLNQNYEQTLVKQTEKYSATVAKGTVELFQGYDKNLTDVVGKFHGVLHVLNEKLGSLEVIMKENGESLDNYITKIEKLNNETRQEKK